MQQQLANYDPYTIQQVQFFVQKKTKYTTLKSILVSIAILTLTIVLNLGLVEQLWIPRNKLSVTSSQRKLSEQKFTQGYICVIAKNSSVILPNSTLYTFSQSLNRTTKIFTTTEIFSQNIHILNLTNQRNFQCYNIQGAVINDDIYMQLNVYDRADNFDFLFRIFTADEIMGKNLEENSVYYQTASSGMDYFYFYNLKKIQGIIYDSLLIDYEPEVIYGFSPIYSQVYGHTIQGYSSIRFQSQSQKPFDTSTSYILTRANIGEILGKLLSWFSIFVLIAAFGIKPISQYNYKVELSKKLYDHPKLTRINISLFSYMKYRISFFKRDIFDQAILYTSFEQLQKDLDLMNLIKKQAMMKKLIRQNQFVSKQIDQINGNMGTALIQNNDDDQKHIQDLFISKFLNNQLLSQSQQRDQNNSNQRQQLSRSTNLLKRNTQLNQTPLITQPDPKTAQSTIVSIFKSLDCSQTNISLISNKGQGYKTSWNTILTFIFLASVLWFIIFIGIFKMQPNYSIKAIAADYDQTIMANITINPQDILFRANKSNPTENFFLNALILDQDDNVVDNLTLLEGTDCEEQKQNLNQNSSGWLCLSHPIDLYNDGRGNKRKLGLKIVVNGFGFYSPNIEILFWQYNIVNNEIIKSKVYNNYLYSSSQVYRHDGQAVIYINENKQLSIPDYIDSTLQFNPNKQFWTCNKPLMTTQAYFKGITYQIHSQMIKLTKQVPTIWDVIDTAWGIVVLAFSVFLSRITRYLNVKERQKITKGEQNQTRNDIVSIVSTQYKLLNRVFAKQLQQVKYFYKSNLDDFNTKIR